jgi:hypothetical protein
VCVHVFIGVSAHMCISICIYTVFLQKDLVHAVTVIRGIVRITVNGVIVRSVVIRL